MKGLFGPRVVLPALAAVLFVFGIVFGFRLGQPEPRPDLGSLKATEPQAESGTAERFERSGTEGEVPPASTREDLDAPVPPMTSGLEPGADVGVPDLVAPASRKRIAIVIDDLGRSVDDLDRLRALNVPLTYSVLPFEVRTGEVVAELNRRQVEFMCHLPMEPKNGANPGIGALLMGMGEHELRAATKGALAATPGAVGVNNHMGSGIVANRSAMETILGVISEQRLFFVDSRTSVDTLGFTIARELGIPATERQVFLDSDRDPAAIEVQFQRLLSIAASRGSALAIAHPHLETLQVLARGIPVARAQGIEFVTASSLLQR